MQTRLKMLSVLLRCGNIVPTMIIEWLFMCDNALISFSEKGYKEGKKGFVWPLWPLYWW